MLKLPLELNVPANVGFRIKIGIGAFERMAPQDAIAPASIVRLPDNSPTKND
jgi:hypothetical protein